MRIVIMMAMALVMTGCALRSPIQLGSGNDDAPKVEVKRTVKARPCIVPPGENACDYCDTVICIEKRPSAKVEEKKVEEKEEGGKSWWQSLKRKQN